MSVKLLTEQHLEILRSKRGCTGSLESTFVKIPYCWKSHVLAHFNLVFTVWLSNSLMVSSIKMVDVKILLYIPGLCT